MTIARFESITASQPTAGGSGLGWRASLRMAPTAEDRPTRPRENDPTTLQQQTDLSKTPPHELSAQSAVLSMVPRAVTGAVRPDDTQQPGASKSAVKYVPPTHDRGEEVFEAIDSGDPDALAALLEEGVPAGVVDDDGNSALHKAAEGESACAKLLVAALHSSTGVYEAKNADGETCLMVAIKYEDAELCGLYISHGAACTQEAVDRAREGGVPEVVAAVTGEVVAERGGVERDAGVSGRRASVSGGNVDEFTEAFNDAETTSKRRASDAMKPPQPPASAPPLTQMYTAPIAPAATVSTTAAATAASTTPPPASGTPPPAAPIVPSTTSSKKHVRSAMDYPDLVDLYKLLNVPSATRDDDCLEKISTLLTSLTPGEYISVLPRLLAPTGSPPHC